MCWVGVSQFSILERTSVPCEAGSQIYVSVVVETSWCVLRGVLVINVHACGLVGFNMLVVWWV